MTNDNKYSIMNIQGKEREVSLMEYRYEVKGYTVSGCGYRWKVWFGTRFVGEFCDTSIGIRTSILCGKIR